MMHKIPNMVISVLAAFQVVHLAGCSGGGGGGGSVPLVLSTTTPFDGPLTTITLPVTFNASAAGQGINPYFDGRSTDHQVRIDPAAKTVEIFFFGGEAFLTFTGVDFTAGTSTVEHFDGGVPGYTADTLTILLPGAASGIEWSSYAVWDSQPIGCSPILCLASTYFEALSIGILTDDDHLPTGTGIYTGHMNGRYTNGDTVIHLAGDASVTANFSDLAVTGEFTDINATDLSAGISFNASISGGDYHGTATGGGMSGPITGSFYGPDAEETGGVFQISQGDYMAVGAFAAQK